VTQLSPELLDFAILLAKESGVSCSAVLAIQPLQMLAKSVDQNQFLIRLWSAAATGSTPNKEIVKVISNKGVLKEEVLQQIETSVMPPPPGRCATRQSGCSCSW
jgi:hypothetical protein